MNTGLVLHELRAGHGGAPVLDGLSLQAAPGELLVLAGPSGGGKSTLLRVIAGLLEAESGEIWLDGARLDGRPPRERPVGMVFQHHGLLPHLDVLQNLCFGLRARGLRRSAAEARARAAAATLGLDHLLARYPRELSGGERQRVALGRALLRDARLLLMDEPLSSLDAPLRARMRSEILALHRRIGGTTLYVTHDQAEALSLADRLGILHQGRLQQIGPPELLYARPANLFVARFLGNPAINLLQGAITDTGLCWRGETVAPASAPSRPVQLGVRPEHVSVAGSRWATAPTPLQQFDAVLEGVEHLGDRKCLQLRCGDERLLARVEPEFVAEHGQSLQIGLVPTMLHCFDPHSGERLP